MLFCQRRVAVARAIPQKCKQREEVRRTMKHGIVFVSSLFSALHFTLNWDRKGDSARDGRRSKKVYTNLVNSLSCLFLEISKRKSVECVKAMWMLDDVNVS